MSLSKKEIETLKAATEMIELACISSLTLTLQVMAVNESFYQSLINDAEGFESPEAMVKELTGDMNAIIDAVEGIIEAHTPQDEAD